MIFMQTCFDDLINCISIDTVMHTNFKFLCFFLILFFRHDGGHYSFVG